MEGLAWPELTYGAATPPMFRQLFTRPSVLRSLALCLCLGGVLLGSACAIATPSDNADATSSEHLATRGNSVQAATVIAYRSPTCGCCKGWVEHMRQQGFQVEDHVIEDIESVKREYNIPIDLASCHTATVAGYAIEGHVPAADVRKLLEQQIEVLGIAVPGMPIGSPGMESGNIREPYTVFSFDASGPYQAFARHNS